MHDDHGLTELDPDSVASHFVRTTTSPDDSLPNLPVLSATRARLDVLIQGSTLDLSSIAKVILSDAGATLQVFRQAGEEYGQAEGDRTRVEDCLVRLGRERWYEVICASETVENGPLATEWRHCRVVALCARELAECIGNIAPDQAYLVGLLYRLGRFPDLLGWSSSGLPSVEYNSLGFMLSLHWRLPQCLVSALQELKNPATSSCWVELLQVADLMARSRAGEV